MPLHVVSPVEPSASQDEPEPMLTAVGPAGNVPERGKRRAYVIDDDSQIRKSLHFLLGASAIDAWPFSNCADFIGQLERLAPAPILLDIRMPGIDGLQMLEILAQRQVPWPVIVMTAHGDVTVAVRAMKLGAIDFLEKPFTPDMLDSVLNQAFGLLGRIERALARRDYARRVIGLMSERESQIISILMEGASNKAVASRLGISVRTVEMHRGNAFAKLGIKSVAEAIALTAHSDPAPQELASPRPRPTYTG